MSCFCSFSTIFPFDTIDIHSRHCLGFHCIDRHVEVNKLFRYFEFSGQSADKQLLTENHLLSQIENAVAEVRNSCCNHFCISNGSIDEVGEELDEKSLEAIAKVCDQLVELIIQQCNHENILIKKNEDSKESTFPNEKTKLAQKTDAIALLQWLMTNNDIIKSRARERKTFSTKSTECMCQKDSINRIRAPINAKNGQQHLQSKQQMLFTSTQAKKKSRNLLKVLIDQLAIRSPALVVHSMRILTFLVANDVKMENHMFGTIDNIQQSLALLTNMLTIHVLATEDADKFMLLTAVELADHMLHLLDVVVLTPIVLDALKASVEKLVKAICDQHALLKMDRKFSCKFGFVCCFMHRLLHSRLTKQFTGLCIQELSMVFSILEFAFDSEADWSSCQYALLVLDLVRDPASLVQAQFIATFSTQPVLKIIDKFLLNHVVKAVLFSSQQLLHFQNFYDYHNNARLIVTSTVSLLTVLSRRDAKFCRTLTALSSIRELSNLLESALSDSNTVMTVFFCLGSFLMSMTDSKQAQACVSHIAQDWRVARMATTALSSLSFAHEFQHVFSFFHYICSLYSTRAELNTFLANFSSLWQLKLKHAHDEQERLLNKRQSELNSANDEVMTLADKCMRFEAEIIALRRHNQALDQTVQDFLHVCQEAELRSASLQQICNDREAAANKKVADVNAANEKVISDRMFVCMHLEQCFSKLVHLANEYELKTEMVSKLEAEQAHLKELLQTSVERSTVIELRVTESERIAQTLRFENSSLKLALADNNKEMLRMQHLLHELEAKNEKLACDLALSNNQLHHQNALAALIHSLSKSETDTQFLPSQLLDSIASFKTTAANNFLSS